MAAYASTLKRPWSDRTVAFVSGCFEVVRTYTAVADPDDVRRDDDGTWRVSYWTMCEDGP